MSDEPALIRLVCDHRDEPLPRLIYADWLDDIGDPPSVLKSTFLRTWCQLHDTPLSDLDGYSELAEQLERLRPELPDFWCLQMDGFRFYIGNTDRASARADAFLRRILDPDDYELLYPNPRDGGWVVSFRILPTVESAGPKAREKEHKRGGVRAKRATPAPGRRHQLAYQAATPLFVTSATGRVDWHRGPQTPTRALAKA
jgi:uncharacterized protein (TIGR02996 family)